MNAQRCGANIFAVLCLILVSCSGGHAVPVVPHSLHAESLGNGISVAHIYSYANSGTSTTITLDASPAPGNGDTLVAVVYGYNTAGQCYTMSSTYPTGWSNAEADPLWWTLSA